MRIVKLLNLKANVLRIERCYNSCNTVNCIIHCGYQIGIKPMPTMKMDGIVYIAYDINEIHFTVYLITINLPHYVLIANCV